MRQITRSKLALTTSFALSATMMCSQSFAASTAPDHPNILLVVADDMGFADLGSYGSEIETPNLDSLASSGVRMTNFHTTPACSPTRASLLTGVDPHKAGLGNMAEELAPNQEGQPGYEGHLNDQVAALPALFKDAGYNTYLTGKWHLGKEEGNRPTDRGFDHSFSLLVGGASHFSDMKPSYAPSPEIKAPYAEDGALLDELPDNFEYSSQFYADRMIEYIEADKDSNAPFFGMLSYTAPHWPLQAPKDAMEKYRGRYDAGYDQIFNERLEAQKSMGLIPADAEGAPRPPKGRLWDSLSSEEQKVESRAMEIYAAMVDELDAHTGRVFDYLKQNDLYDNTIVIFMSDNGAEGHDLDETWPADLFPEIRKVIDETNDFSYEQMGRVGSYTFYGPNWAWAGAPAFRLHKGFPTEGGTRSIAIIKAPDLEGGEINDSLTSVKDIAPTLLELAGIEHPGTEYKGREITPITGTSLMPVLSDNAEVEDRVLGGELFGKYYIRQGDWKLVMMPKPYGDDEVQLFNLSEDLGERHDLSQEHPEKLAEMRALWEQYAEENDVIIPNWVSGY